MRDLLVIAKFLVMLSKFYSTARLYSVTLLVQCWRDNIIESLKV